MQESFHSYINTFLKPSQRILLAISGGLDSIVLLHLAAHLKLNCAVAHVNFQLRGSESDEDELFVKSLAQHHHVQFYSIRVDTRAFAEAKKISTQMAARELRYQWFEQLMHAEHYDYLFTAHHLNDSLETSLLNFTRGTGISGLRGIQKQNQKTIRPLLEFTREEIALYAKAHQLTWREDSSNKTSDYSRNFIRHHIITQLKELNPSLEHTFANNTKRLLAEEELVDFALHSLREKFIIEKSNQFNLKIDLFNPFTNQAGILWEIVNPFGFNLDQCEGMVAAMRGQSGKQFHSATHVLIIDREELIITESHLPVDGILIHENDTLIATKDFNLTINTLGSWPLKTDSSEATVDKDQLTYPLLLRPWKAGDSFYPLGMYNSKKISDFLIDLKVSVADKNRVWVLESESNIVWVVGFRIDDRFKITPQTKSIISFKIISSIA